MSSQITIKKISNLFFLVILAISILTLFLNINIFSVMHQKSSGGLPVIVYDTYSSIETTLIYLIIILCVINSFFILYKKLDKYSLYPVFFTPIISFSAILLFITYPHLLIINPSGQPPTLVESIEFGGFLMITLVVALIINSFLILYDKGLLKNYSIGIIMLIISLLVSHFIHETGHAFFVLISGGTITHYYPFPIIFNGQLTTGYVTFTNIPSYLVPLVLLGGEIFQWLLIVILAFVLLRIKLRNSLRLFLTFLFLVSWLDFPLYVINNSIGLPHWFIIGSTEGDIINFTNLTKFPLWGMIIIAIFQLCVGILVFSRNLYKKNIKGEIWIATESIKNI
ncbi:MAG: hypothetical protein ACFFD5_14380 [Candidatus Thorarchaeota archaeon]